MSNLKFNSILGRTIYEVLEANHHISKETVHIISKRIDTIENILSNQCNDNNLIFFFMLMLWLEPSLKEKKNLPKSHFISAIGNDFSLNFDKNSFYKGDCKLISDYISYTKYMKSINIREKELNDEDLKDFCSEFSDLTRIDLSSIANIYIPNNL